MISRSRLDCVVFPVRAMLRDGVTSLVVREDGKVFCGDQLTESKLVAQCSPESPAFQPFMFFWSVVFIENRLSMDFNTLVRELLAGNLEQDQDCPTLFFDKLCTVECSDGIPFVSKPSDKDAKVLGYKVFQADEYGVVKAYNPDSFYMNSCYALAEDTRIKFYQVIKDFEGNDFPHGWSASVVTIAGRPPVFDPDFRTRDDADLPEMGKILLEECPVPGEEPEDKGFLDIPF